MQSVNRLAAAASNSCRTLRCDRQPTVGLGSAAVQRDMAIPIADRVSCYGDAPSDLSEETALAELLSSVNFYDEEPKHTAA
jgi:hypothetical protein